MLRIGRLQSMFCYVNLPEALWHTTFASLAPDSGTRSIDGFLLSKREVDKWRHSSDCTTRLAELKHLMLCWSCRRQTWCSGLSTDQGFTAKPLRTTPSSWGICRRCRTVPRSWCSRQLQCQAFRHLRARLHGGRPMQNRSRRQARGHKKLCWVCWRRVGGDRLACTMLSSPLIEYLDLVTFYDRLGPSIWYYVIVISCYVMSCCLVSYDVRLPPHGWEETSLTGRPFRKWRTPRSMVLDSLLQAPHFVGSVLCSKL